MDNPFEKITFLILEVKEAQQRLESKIDKIKISDENDLVSRTEKAKQLGISLPTIRSWELRGLVSPIRLGRRVYFKKGIAPPNSLSSLH